MDILRKMFESDKNQKAADNKEDPQKDEFRKPQWFEEVETDDELFDDDRKFVFQVFTNPMELQKHFERQMQLILESINKMEKDGAIPMEKNLKEEFLKPGFESSSIMKGFEQQTKKFMDTDLDGEIVADDLHSLMQGLKTKDEELASILPRNDNRFNRLKKKPMTDEEIIMGKLHGTFNDDDGDGKPRAPPTPTRPEMMTPMTPMIPRPPFSGAFEGSYQGPKMFRQSVMTKTVRKPDGSYETTKVSEDSNGNRRTTITRTINGKTETVTKCEGAATEGNGRRSAGALAEGQAFSDPNIYVTKEGYAVPRLW